MEDGQLPRLCPGRAGHCQRLAPALWPRLASEARAGLQTPAADSPCQSASCLRDWSGHGPVLVCGNFPVCPLPGWEPGLPWQGKGSGQHSHPGGNSALTPKWKEQCQEMVKSENGLQVLGPGDPGSAEGPASFCWGDIYPCSQLLQSGSLGRLLHGRA